MEFKVSNVFSEQSFPPNVNSPFSPIALNEFGTPVPYNQMIQSNYQPMQDPSIYGYPHQGTPNLPLKNPICSQYTNYQPFPNLVPLSGKRKALLIGINYLNNPNARLNGPIADVHRMIGFLSRYNFQNILVLTDDQMDPSRQPTKYNIFSAMNWLLADVQNGDSLFFYYSGHGSQVLDLDGDEVDGLDETILPVDYQTTGQIIDDEIHDYLVKPLPWGSRLTAVMDCCHSGTGMDLPYIFNPSTLQLQTYPIMVVKPNCRYIDFFNSKQSVGDVFLFSGCMDHQTAADTTIKSRYGSRSTGAMSNAFIRVLTDNPQQSYVQVIYAIQKMLHSTGVYTQIPQLSSGRPFDLKQVFSL